MKSILAAAAFVALFITPSFAADDCAASLAKIDDAMQSATVDDATKAQLDTLVTDAKTSKDNGDEATCSTKAMEALALLGM